MFESLIDPREETAARLIALNGWCGVSLLGDLPFKMWWLRDGTAVEACLLPFGTLIGCLHVVGVTAAAYGRPWAVRWLMAPWFLLAAVCAATDLYRSLDPVRELAERLAWAAILPLSLAAPSLPALAWWMTPAWHQALTRCSDSFRREARSSLVSFMCIWLPIFGLKAWLGRTPGDPAWVPLARVAALAALTLVYYRLWSPRAAKG